jgi:hypothetical protein
VEKGEQVTDEQKQRAHDLLYSCESREDLCERIVALEELVDEMLNCDMDQHWSEMTRRAKELGIEVGP